MSKDTSQTTSRNSHLHVTNEFALLEVIPDAKRLRDSKNLTSIYMMEGKPEEWLNDGMVEENSINRIEKFCFQENFFNSPHRTYRPYGRIQVKFSI